MATGRRYDSEPKLNIGKVVAVVVALAVVLMLIISIVNSLNNKNKKNKREEISVTTTYFSAYKDGKWGVIDNNGKEIIPPTYDEMVIIPNKEKDLFIVVENQNYDDKTYTTKVLNKNNEQILSEYSNVEPIQNSLNSTIIWYEQDILKYKTSEGGFKLINFKGEEITSSVYSNVYSLAGVENSVIVEANGVKGLVNGSTNQVVLQCSYTDIQTLLPNNYSKGYIVTNTNNLKGIVDANSKIIFECKYEDIAHFTGNDRYYVKENGTWKIVDNQGNAVIENPSAVNIESDYLIVNNNGQYGLMDIKGQTLINPSYQLRLSKPAYFLVQSFAISSNFFLSFLY